MGNNRKRISREERYLNANLVEEYLLEWSTKWNIADIKNKEETIGPIPKVVRDLPPSFSAEFLRKQIAPCKWNSLLSQVIQWFSCMGKVRNKR